MVLGSFKSVSRKFQGCLMKVSRIFQECFIIFKGVSGVFQGSFKKTFKVFKKVHVSWHSSQLPEQKEGLFHKNKICSSKSGLVKFKI